MRRRDPLGGRFRRVWWAGVISSSGDGMFLTAFPLLAATLTRDPVAIAGVTVAVRLPWLLLSLLAGAIADRRDRRHVMVVADIVRCVVVLALGAAVLADWHRVWLLYVCAFGLGLGEIFHASAAQALIPTLVTPPQLVRANASLTSAEVITNGFLGPPAGAALFAVAPAVPFLADGVSFAAAAGFIGGLPAEPPRPKASTSLLADMREGVQFMLRHPVLRRLVTLLGLLNVLYYATESVLILYTIEKLHAGKAEYTAMFLAIAAGTVATQWMITPLQRRFGIVVTITLALWLWAAAMTGIALTTSALVAIGFYFLLGTGDGLWRVLTVSLRQTVTPNRLLGRVTSAYRMVAQGVIPIGAAFGGLVAKTFGLRAPYLVAAVAFIVIAAIGPIVLRPARDAALTSAAEA